MCLAAMPACAATPEDGRRAYEAGRFTDAMGIWSELSRQGNAAAAFGLGLLYDLGNGIEADPATAFVWYKAAAEAGLPAAQFNVGAMYDAGRGVPRSTANAALWYAKAAARGHHRAQFDLGQLYEQGDGVPKNPDAAAAWYRAAAGGGVPAAGVRLRGLATSRRPGGSLANVTLASPARNVKVTLSTDNSAVELVWVAPPEPQPVHYEVQVRELGDANLRSVFSTSINETSILIPLPADTGFYVWNVGVVGQDGSYVTGEWNWFSVGPSPVTQQSMASAPDTTPAGH